MVSENTKWESQQQDAYLPQDFKAKISLTPKVTHQIGTLKAANPTFTCEILLLQSREL
jgi:hypothetical protein